MKEAMELVARLVHAEPGARVVQVSARRQGQTLGTALGEAATAEEAEDRALTRLHQRLGPDPRQPRQQPPAPRPPAAGPVRRPELPEAGGPSAPMPVPSAAAPPRPLPEEPPPDPEDWSGELAQIDLQLRRIGWQREQEATYLQRAFGHPSRGRITTFADLIAYLQVLQGLADGSDPAQAPVPLRRPELLSQCDQLLAQLGWDAGRGRQFLERHFALASRQQLSDSQLLQFNMLLEEALIDPASVALPSTAGS
ncbi:MAG: hypothetical protein EA413_03810 [Cyanobium sp. PLM2.Bin73]|nr:MAG: hypothetical protein EA413_03810 [Cyanobium sp. PLM2.Bin73]